MFATYTWSITSLSTSIASFPMTMVDTPVTDVGLVGSYIAALGANTGERDKLSDIIVIAPRFSRSSPANSARESLMSCLSGPMSKYVVLSDVGGYSAK